MYYVNNIVQYSSEAVMINNFEGFSKYNLLSNILKYSNYNAIIYEI